MKLTKLLIVTWCSIIMARSETTKSDQETLLKRASEQLERLAPYRRIVGDQGGSDLTDLLETWRSPVDQNYIDGTKNNADQSVPWEIFEILPEQTKSDATKRVDDEQMITIGVITDPKYAAIMQERIKRGYDIGSTSLLTSIAGGVLSGIASASTSSAAKASTGSSLSSYKPPVYGAPPVEHTVDTYHPYEEKPFGAWDFKKAIFGTLFQALKAIGGGVLALKGQLVKGGGYLLSGKGRAVSKAGEVITSFGKQLAASAVTEPKHYPPETYYDHPSIQNIGHDPSYQGPPPNSDDYSEAPNDYTAHETYGVPSDDNGQGGLLIVTPTKSDLDVHSDQHTNTVVQEKPNLSQLEESFGGPAKGVITNLLNSVPKGSIGSQDQTVVSQDNNNVEPLPPAQHPAPIYGVPDHYTANHDANPIQNYEQNYPAIQDNVYQPPELSQFTSSHHKFPNLGDPNLSIQPGVEYPPLHVQQFQYPTNPNPHNFLLDSPKLPHDDGGTSVYSSLSIDTEPQLTPLKTSLLGDLNTFNLPKLQPHADFYGQPQFANHLHSSLGDPLKVPLLNPTGYYWQTQGSLIPASTLDTLNHFRKRNVLQRRAFAKRLARYSSLQMTRLHRL